MIELPPAGQYFWLQFLVIGFLSGILMRDISFAGSALFAFFIVLGMTWFNAVICGAVTNDTSLIRGSLKGLGGFGIVLPVIIPFLLIAPASCALCQLICRQLFFQKERVPNIDSYTAWQCSLLNFVMLICILSVGCWQLSMFVKHRAF
jgi:hypothetical protein